MSGALQGAGGVGGLLSVTVHGDTGDSAYYPTYDANGNISEYVDDTDSVVAHYEYSPFGKITSSSGSKSSDFRHRFSTKYHDSETALYYYGYRYYSSELGRWLNRDPIGEQGGVNFYLTTGNAPTYLFDSYGLFVAPVLLEPTPITRMRTVDHPSQGNRSSFSKTKKVRKKVRKKMENLADKICAKGEGHHQLSKDSTAVFLNQKMVFSLLLLLLTAPLNTTELVKFRKTKNAQRLVSNMSLISLGNLLTLLMLIVMKNSLLTGVLDPILIGHRKCGVQLRVH